MDYARSRKLWPVREYLHVVSSRPLIKTLLGRFAVVEFQQPAKTLRFEHLSSYGAGSARSVIGRWNDIAKPLMIALIVKMRNIFADDMSQRFLAKQDHAIHAFGLNRPHESFGEGIQVMTRKAGCLNRVCIQLFRLQTKSNASTIVDLSGYLFQFRFRQEQLQNAFYVGIELLCRHAAWYKTKNIGWHGIAGRATEKAPIGRQGSADREVGRVPANSPEALR